MLQATANSPFHWRGSAWLWDGAWVLDLEGNGAFSKRENVFRQPVRANQREPSTRLKSAQENFCLSTLPTTRDVGGVAETGRSISLHPRGALLFGLILFHAGKGQELLSCPPEIPERPGPSVRPSPVPHCAVGTLYPNREHNLTI